MLILGDCTFDTMTGDPLSHIINIAYRDTSKYLLNILNTQYHLKDHLGVSGREREREREGGREGGEGVKSV